MFCFLNFLRVKGFVKTTHKFAISDGIMSKFFVISNRLIKVIHTIRYPLIEIVIITEIIIFVEFCSVYHVKIMNYPGRPH